MDDEVFAEHAVLAARAATQPSPGALRDLVDSSRAARWDAVQRARR